MLAKHYSRVSPFAISCVSVMISHVNLHLRLTLALPFLIFSSFFPALTAPQSQTALTATNSLLPGPKPPDAPLEWKQLVGVYRFKEETFTIFEKDQHLNWHFGDYIWQLTPDGQGTYFIPHEHQLDGSITAKPDSNGKISNLLVHENRSFFNENGAGEMSGDASFSRSDAGADPARFYHVTPAQPVAELREKALKLSPPSEPGPFRKSDLVELATLDPAIHLDIRYATANNFLSTPVYSEARAFMQRPAAEALLRVLRKLQTLGYGLLIHDAYRPWYVTKIFWDATPPEGKIFVADPQKGSKHNRGCAVDLTLYDLATGQPVEMPGLYDEMSPRSFPNFPGGTSLQRWHRDLLRRAMESEGFTVNEDEWWHFDYKDWKQYGILNVPFEKIAVSQQPAAVSH